ncbi:CZB domain-containing protein [Thalassovita sp.]|uniref:CZB domain-containing protein n=1 Tax=Thalassovita sp. TaxID=1979401 RepID=UPI002B27B763|nr:CZB domain-containing protein [Thalassovita sp.]
MQTQTAILLQDELDDAMRAHSDWKLRLREAAVYGDTDLPVEEIKSDVCCDFGEWLQSLPHFLRNSGEVREVDRLHKMFHACAGGIAEQIYLGQFDIAISNLSGHEYNDLSVELAKAMMRWKLAVQ